MERRPEGAVRRVWMATSGERRGAMSMKAAWAAERVMEGEEGQEAWW